MVTQARQKSGKAKPAGADEVIRQVMAERHTRSSHTLTGRKLRESEDKFRTIFMDSPYGLTLSTFSEGRLLDVNPSFSNLMGYSMDELIGKTTRELGLWSDNADRAKMVSMFKKAGFSSQEVILLNKNRQKLNCVISAKRTLLLDNTECLLSVVEDITERKKAEQTLRENERKFKEFFRNSQDLCYMLSAEGKILDVNRHALEVLGYKHSDLIGKPFGVVYAPESLPRFKQLFSLWLKTGVIRNEEMTILTSKGQKRKVLVNVGAVRDDEGKILYSSTVHTDITNRIYMEQDLKNSQIELRNLAMRLELARENEKKIISREIHDELGQLMTGLKMDIAWVNGRLSAEQQLLKNKTQSMLELVDEGIRSVKRITTQLRPRILDEMGLGAAVEWQVERFEKQSGIKCKTSFRPADIDVAMEISIVMFRVLQEALTNVARHSEATAVAVNLKAVDHKLVLQVKDNGVGITPAQLSNQHSSGLTGIRERMLAIGGDLHVRSFKGRGTTLIARVTQGQTGD